VLSANRRELETTIENPWREMIKMWREGVGVEPTRDVYSPIPDLKAHQDVL
jgi:hypothetical protein